MATIATRINSSGTYLVNGSFDEITTSTIRTTTDTVYARLLDEVVFNPATSGLYIGNSLSYSQDMSQTSVWNYSSGGSGVPPVVTPNAALAPDGTLTANRVFFNSGPVTGTGQSSLNQGNAVPLTTGTSQTFSVWMRVETTATSVNMFNGEAINSLAIDTNWTRYSLPITYSSPTAYGVRIAKREIWGTGGSANVLIWGAQMNPGLTATIHVPTGANATPISIAAKKESVDGTVYVTGSFDEFTGTASVVDGLVAYYDPAYSSSYSGSGANLYNLIDGIAATLNGTYSAGTAAVGTSVSGMQTIRLTNSNLISAPNNISHIQAPSFTNITTVSIWFYQHSYNGISRYILDGRTGGSEGWIYNGSIGSNWSTGITYVNGGASSGTPSWLNWGGDATGVWKNVTFIANTPFTDDINVFSRFSDNEGLDVTFGPILIYNRVLTQAENALNFNALCRRYGI
jgi:hypothetical protein